MLTEKDIKEMELKVPKYDFIEPKKDEPVVSPIKRQIAKIQETASMFTLYDVYKGIGQLDKAIADKEQEIKSHKEMKELFEAELVLIEKALGVSKLEEQYKNECLAEAAIAELESKNNETNS